MRRRARPRYLGRSSGCRASRPSLAESISDFLGSKISSLGSSVPSTPLDIAQRPDTTAALREGHRQYRRLRQLEPHAPQSRLRNDELRRWLGVDVPHVTPDTSVHPEALPRALAWFITRCSDGEDVQRALRQLGKLLDDPNIEPKYKGAALRRLAAGLHRIELPGIPEQALELITTQRLREVPSRFVRNSIDRDLRRLFEHPSVSLRAQAELLVWESELRLQLEDLRKPLPGESQQAALNRQAQAKALEGEYHARRDLAGRIRAKRDESTPTTGLDLSRRDEDTQGVSGLPAIAIGQLLRLKSLNLSGQPIQFLPPSLHRLEHLETLDISRTRLGSQIETVFKLVDKAPKLKDIYLHDTMLTRRALEAISNFKMNREGIDIHCTPDFRRDWLNENLIDKVGATATLQKCLTHAEKTHQKLGVAFIDIDHFGAINKTYGELVGDAGLRHFCEVTVRQALDKVMGSAAETIFARWGGEEFLLLAPGKGRQAMTELVRELRHALAVGRTRSRRRRRATSLLRGASAAHRARALSTGLARKALAPAAMISAPSVVPPRSRVSYLQVAPPLGRIGGRPEVPFGQEPQQRLHDFTPPVIGFLEHVGFNTRIDVINALISELVRTGYELPAYSAAAERKGSPGRSGTLEDALEFSMRSKFPQRSSRCTRKSIMRPASAPAAVSAHPCDVIEPA
jgi:diguanylate cyclase (GGDEF)-like protein